MKNLLWIVLFAACVANGCKKQEENHAHSGSKAPEKAAESHPGATGHKLIPLGESMAGPYKCVATRDEGVVRAGGDVPIDVRVTAADATTPPVAAVRFWVGFADAKGSVKAKAEIEDPKEPDRWHTHAEAPVPLPADAKLHVEVEARGGAKHLTSFELRR